MILTIGLIVALLVLFYWIAIKPRGYWKKRDVIHIKPFPFFGLTSEIIFKKKNIYDLLKDVYKRYPNERYIGIHVFRQPQLVIQDLELIKKITIKDFDYFINRTSSLTEDTDPLLSKTLVALEGQKWRDMRAALSPSFTANKMKFLYKLMYQCATQFTEYFQNHESEAISLEMKDISSRFTNDVIATSAFGITTDSLNEKNNEFFENGKSATTFGRFRGTILLLYSIAPFLKKVLKVAVFSPKLTNFFERIVQETISVREKHNIIRPDMIHLLLESSKDHQKIEKSDKDISHTHISRRVDISKKDIVAQGLIFFFAGFDTVSNAISFTSYELALNPQIQRRLQEEIDGVPKSSDGQVPYDVLIGMKYLDMVISEGLRKWPPGIALDRKCVKDYLIEAVSEHEKSFLLEKGISISIPVYAIHHDPKYFPDPDKFDPERFNDENKLNIVPGSYIPFGVGPRNCIASRFALMELKIFFYHILSRFDITTTEKTEIPLKIVNKKLILPEGFWLGLKKRNE